MTLKQEIVTITPGQKIVYVADCCYSPDNVEKIVTLARGADIFFCEAAFLDRDRDKARAKDHLTARQAGIIAREAGVKQLNIFHFSPRYEESPEIWSRKRRRHFKGQEVQTMNHRVHREKMIRFRNLSVFSVFSVVGF